MVINNQNILGVWRLLKWQLIVTVVMCGLLLCLMNANAGLSALLGGLVSIIPNIVFAKLLFHHQGARAAKKIVTSFYKGEALKIVITMTLFAAVFKLTTVTPVIFFVVYILVQTGFWFAPLFFANQRNGPKSD